MRLVGSNFITAGNEHELSLRMSIFMTVTFCWKSKKCFITSICISAYLCDHSKLENQFILKKKEKKKNTELQHKKNAFLKMSSGSGGRTLHRMWILLPIGIRPS